MLINMMKDPIVDVKDTVAWTLGRVCDTLSECIKPDVHLHDLISALVYGLQDNPRIVSNCCWVSNAVMIRECRRFRSFVNNSKN
jgi:importin subunit beta-1